MEEEMAQKDVDRRIINPDYPLHLVDANEKLSRGKMNHRNLVDMIGDADFFIPPVEHQNDDYPNIVKIIDCEDETSIEVYNSVDSKEAAENLVDLLNGKFSEVENLIETNAQLIGGFLNLKLEDGEEVEDFKSSGKDIVVQCSRSIWLLRSTGDIRRPFESKCLTTFNGVFH